MTDKFGIEPQIIPEENEQEIWAPAPGFEEKYEISNFGRVRRKQTKYIRKINYDKNGYPIVCLRRWDYTERRNKMFYVYIHRLVCEAFNGPPTEQYNICDHIDHCIINNYYRNLRWTDYKGNRENCKDIKSLKIYVNKTPIVFLDLNGNFVQRFDSVLDAHEKLGLSIIQIQHNLRGQRDPFKDGYFKTEAEYLSNIKKNDII